MQLRNRKLTTSVEDVPVRARRVRPAEDNSDELPSDTDVAGAEDSGSTPTFGGGEGVVDSMASEETVLLPREKRVGGVVTAFRHARAWSVHLFTGLGLLVSAATLHLAIYPQSGEPSFMLFAKLNWLAILIDAVDGTLARRFDVKRYAAGLDGALLDNIIDFQTFALLPALGVMVFETWLAEEVRIALAAAVLVSAGYAFCQTSAKTDTAFVGFPSYWNVVLFYVHILRPSEATVIAVYAVCFVLSFIPIHFIYPTKTPDFFWITMTGAYAWAVCMLVPVVAPDSPHAKTAIQLSLVYVVYYTAASLYLDSRRRKALKISHPQ